MKPMKVVRSSSYRRKLQKKKQNQKRVILAAVALLVICLIVFIATRGGGQQQPASPAVQTESQAVQPLSNGGVVQLALNVGDTRMLVLPDSADIRDTEFSADDSGAVRCDAAGRVDAMKEGTARIVVSGRGFSSVCEVTVSAAAPASPRTEVTSAILANTEIAAANAAKGTEDLYNITVNRRTNTVTVYTYDAQGKYTVPVRAMVASCGTGGEDITPTGDYAIYFREEWHPLFGDVFGLYVSGFDGPYLFHSVPYHSEDHADLKAEEFNKLGTNASQGCVRMMAADVKWVFENCAMNTPVKVIDADASADPLGKPETIRIDERITWDPTDPDPKNPYRDKQPEIGGVAEAAVALGGSFDPMQGITAKDICGNDITDRVRITGAVITEKKGAYLLTYSVTDALNHTTEVDRLVVVS